MSGVQYLSPSRPGIPAFNGTLASGLSPWWLFDYVNGSTAGIWNATVILTVIVVNGTAIALAISWSQDMLGASWETMVGAPTLDSAAVMQTAVGVNTSYMAAHPDLNASFGVSWHPGGPFYGWFWTVGFTSCAPFIQVFGSGSTSYNGSSFGMFINDTTGAPDGTTFPQSTQCSSLG